jgi:hypothetical protein
VGRVVTGAELEHDRRQPELLGASSRLVLVRQLALRRRNRDPKPAVGRLDLRRWHSSVAIRGIVREPHQQNGYGRRDGRGRTRARSRVTRSVTRPTARWAGPLSSGWVCSASRWDTVRVGGEGGRTLVCPVQDASRWPRAAGSLEVVW